jgi:hypothetical protein
VGDPLGDLPVDQGDGVARAQCDGAAADVASDLQLDIDLAVARRPAEYLASGVGN